MKKNIRFIVYAGLIAAIYVVLTYLQNFILPDSATWSVQCRFSEALCVLAFFTPAAVPGLAIGCLLFNVSYAGALPLDWVVGTLATLLSCWAMWKTRKIRLPIGKAKIPLLGLAMPALSNAFLVGWELTIYIGGAFWLNAILVSAGELIVLYTAGLVLYMAITSRGLDTRLFGQ